MQKKKFVTMLGAVALVAAVGIGSTFALLSDKTGVATNTITVGDVEISLKESDVTYEDGTGYVDGDGEDQTVDASEENGAVNEYDTIVPGDTVFKDPTITTADSSENSYVFLYVTGLDEATAEGFTYEINDAWTLVKAAEGKTADGVYAYNAAVSGTDVTLSAVAGGTTCASFFVNDVLTYEASNTGAAQAINILIQGGAVQSSHVETLDEALTALGW